MPASPDTPRPGPKPPSQRQIASRAAGGGGLNPAQRDAVRTRSGPLLVLAGAGTGKTRVITFRIVELIRSGIEPDRILAVTFTRKAAREMKERATALLRSTRTRVKEVPEISTFHSLCVRILRSHIHHLGYPKDFAIYDRGDQESVVRSALREIRVGQDKLRPGDLLAIIGSHKSHGLAPQQATAAATSEREQIAAAGYERYQSSLRAAGAVDFDDLLLLTDELFERFPRVRRAEAKRYDHLLIDEYQDTNALQYRVAKALAERHRNLCVVGDDDQSIYAWRGAEVEHILRFSADWPDAKVVKLEQNYRSQAPILQLANTLIAHNTTRHQKELRPQRQGGDLPRFVRLEDESVEAEAVVADIRRRLLGEQAPPIQPRDVAILFRTNEQPRSFEMELRRGRIPYVLVGGQSFYDRKEVRDVVAYLRVICHPGDEVSLLRIINTPPRGIGGGTVRLLLEEAVAEGQPLWEVLQRAGTVAGVADYAVVRIERFAQLIEELRGRSHKLPLVEFLQHLLAAVDYRSELVRQYRTAADVEARWASVEELVNACGQYQARSPQGRLREWLDDLTLTERDQTSDQEADDDRRNAVTLMTLHSAKGLEFPHVYLVGMEEGLLPHRRSVADGGAQIAEERRLCYVGVTRARETLTLTSAKTRLKWGKPEPSIPSRFLFEMRGDSARAERAATAAAAALAPAPGKKPARRGKKRAGSDKSGAAPGRAAPA